MPRPYKRLPRRGNGKAAYVLPPTVSNGALLEAGSDRRFRMLVNDLFTVASRMEIVRAHLGRRMRIGGPQYSVLVAVAHLAGERGASVGAVAQAMHVSSAFIASETGKCAARAPAQTSESRRRSRRALKPCAGRPPQDRSRGGRAARDQQSVLWHA
jgi:hypothetical protein